MLDLYQRCGGGRFVRDMVNKLAKDMQDLMQTLQFKELKKVRHSVHAACLIGRIDGESLCTRKTSMGCGVARRTNTPKSTQHRCSRTEKAC